DPVRGEKRERPMEESDRRRRCLVLEWFGVGQAREPVDRRVKVGVANPPALSPLRRPPEGAVASVDLPADAVGDLPDLLHVDVDHVPGIAGGDRARLTQVPSVGSDVADPVQAQAVPPPGHGPHAAVDPMASGAVTSDPAGGPLLFPPPVLDQLHHPPLQAGRAVRGGAGVLLEPGCTGSPVASDPLRERGASYVELRSDVRDRTTPREHLVDRTPPSDSRQWSITVGHGTGLLPADEWLQHPPSCRSGTRSFIPAP